MAATDERTGGMMQFLGRVVAICSLAVVAPVAAAQDEVPGASHVADVEEATNDALAILAQHNLGLRRAEVVTLPLAAEAGAPITFEIPLDGIPYEVTLRPHSVRSPKYQLLVQEPDGTLVEAAPGPVRTLRGTVAGHPDAIAAGSWLESGLHAMIDLGDGERFWIESLATLLGMPDRYAVYRSSDVIGDGGTCAMGGEDQALLAHVKGDIAARPVAAGGADGTCVAELACDADTEYFNDYGSVAAVESRINSVINTVNTQYESQVSITHQITTIIVRTGSDPYTSTDAQTRLCQFITEWTNNQQSVPRDLAHLFTGVNLNGGTIGIAADIGDTGVCVSQGGCSGGTYGTFGSYCLAQSDFTSSFSCVTDLTAHELGHLWGAFHCSCPSHTMNPSITCTNNFSVGSTNSITSYRDTRPCLGGSCGGPSGPDNDFCADAESIPCTTSIVLNNAAATPALGGTDPELPSGSPSCQWQGIPSNTHSTVWYSFVAGDTSVQIETCDTTAIQDTIIALYDGTCGSLVQLACGEDECGSTTYMSRICYDGLDPGSTYLIMVGCPGGWSGSTPGQIVLDVQCPCPSVGPVAGACCLPGGSCLDLQTQAECTAAGGTFQGAGTDCGSSSCPGETGACCLSDDTCIEIDPQECLDAGGTFQGLGTVCSDFDGDGVADFCDGCPADPDKTDPGLCGCGVPDTDGDGDGVPDCFDGCPADPDKTSPGQCGCGVPDTDTDGDGVADCVDNCPAVPNPGQEDSDGDGIGDACDDGGGGPSGQLETGTVIVGSTPVTVGLSNTYNSAVVVCSVQYDNNAAPVVARVNNITATSFQVRLVRPAGATLLSESVSYIVMEEGTWFIDGVKCEAQQYTSTVTDENNSWVGEPQSYGHSYSNPVVIGQVMSTNDTDWSVFWCAGSSRTSPPSASVLITGKTVCEDLDTTRADETVGFIVFEAGHGTMGGVEFEARLGPDTVRGVDNSPPYTYAFATAFPAAPAVTVVTQAAMDGGNGGWAQLHGPTAASATTLFLSIDEDTVADSERSHTDEQVAYVVFQSPVVVAPGGCTGDPDCDDGDPCNGIETCVDGQCIPGPITDCNGNGRDDTCDIADGTSLDLNGNGIPDECEAKLESGVVSVGGSPVTVSLANTYTDAVVVCSAGYDSNTTPVVPRVHNVDADSFEVRLVNPSGGSVATESVSYLVMEAGAWTIDGVDCEAQKYVSSVTDENNSWVGETQTYLQSYTSPVVLGQVMTSNDADWSVFWCQGAGRTDPPSSAALVTGKTVCEDSDATRVNEIVGFIVIEAGHGTLGGVVYEALLGADSVRGVGDSPPYAYSFATPFASPPAVTVTTMAAVDGNNGGWAQTHGGTPATATSLFLSVDEDQIKDSERRHTNEQIGYLALAGPVVISGGPMPASGGDVDGDGRVDASDVPALLAAWGSCRGCRADLTGDGRVDASDLARLMSLWNEQE